MSQALQVRAPQPGINTYLLEKGVGARYGNRDADYQKRTFEVMDQASQMICKAKAKGQVTKDLFFRIFNLFCQTRAKMAQDYGLSGKEEFGRRRDDPRAKQYTYTMLEDEYGAAGKAIREIMATKLGDLAKGKKALWGDDTSQFSLKMLTPDEAETYRAPWVKKGADVDEHTRIFFMMNGLEQEYPAMTLMKSLPKEQKLRFIIGETRLKLKDKLVPVAHYLSFQDPAYLQDAEVLVKQCKTLLHHMDRKYIVDGLDEVAQLFVNCVTAPKDKVMGELAKLRFTFTHVTPVERGTCAIGEWLENSILHSHTGNFATYNPKKLVELEAFGKPYQPNFVKAYPKLVSCDGFSSQKVEDQKEG